MNEDVPTWSEGLALVGVAVVVYFLLVACAQLLRRWRNIQFGRLYHLFACSAALLAGLAVSGWHPVWHNNLLRDFGALTILFATIPFITLLNRVLWTRVNPEGRRVDAPRLLADTTGMVVFIGMGLFVLKVFYNRSLPTGLLATSGVAAFIVGFAMQDLLGNILAGFALYVSKPFKIGDWLLVNDSHARVLEVTWRSVRLVTDDDVLLEVPNGDLVKRPIMNFHQPNTHHAMRATLGLHYDVPPARAQAVLRQAAATVPGVCAEPPPQVYVKEFAASSVTYEIKFWIEDHTFKSRILSDVRSHCWYAARRADMEIPYPIVTLHRPAHHDAATAARTAAATALRGHSIFSFLSAAQVDELVQHSPVVLFAQNEPLVEQGAGGASMFLLVRGRVEVQVTRDGDTKTVTQLGPGDCLGEMSALTGEKRSASVVASEEVEAVEITHAAFSSLIQHNPEVLNRLGDLLAQRQSANQQQRSSKSPLDVRPEDMRESVVRRLKSFFQLGD